MCGEFDTDESIAEELYARFVDSVRAFLAELGNEPSPDPGHPLYRYLDTLFHETIAAAAKPAATPTDISDFDRFCMETLVYARIAGFMAAHQPLEEDPMRRLMEAVMTGYAEGEDALERSAHRHTHEHRHSHEHTH
jgi:hypothetical protein